MSQTITLPTSRDRDIGFVFLFLSMVVYFTVPPLAREFGLSLGTVSLISTPIGLLLLVIGLASVFLSRKRLTVEKNQVVVKDGFFHRALHLRFEETPTFKLSGYEDEGKARSEEIWTIHLIDQGRQYLIDRRPDQHVASRTLGERLAKAAGGSLIEVYDGKAFEFKTEELDLCFVKRAALYPDLMGKQVDEPSEKVIDFERGEKELTVGWSYFRSGLLFEIIMIAIFLLAAAFVPIPGGPDGQGFSLYDVERAEGDYRYFIGVAAFLALSLVALFGYKTQVELVAPKSIRSVSKVWGLTVRKSTIPLRELEHISVSVTSRGPYLQLISDKRIVKERFPSVYVARWVAWEIRSFLTDLDPQHCQDAKVEISTEMPAIM